MKILEDLPNTVQDLLFYGNEASPTRYESPHLDKLPTSGANMQFSQREVGAAFLKVLNDHTIISEKPQVPGPVVA
jgi:hypothetical protein